MQNLLTIETLFAIEPRLYDIVETAAQLVELGNNPWVMYSTAKARARYLVGWTARREELRNSVAYDLFIGHLCDKLKI